MELHEVQTEYAKLVQSLQAGDQLGTDPSMDDRRDCPRFHVCTDDIWINSVPDFVVLDLSASGVALSATYPLATGVHIEVGLDSDVIALAEVLGCRLVESATQYTPAEFRINCRFLDSTKGKGLLVHAKRRETQRASAGNGHASPGHR